MFKSSDVKSSEDFKFSKVGGDCPLLKLSAMTCLIDTCELPVLEVCFYGPF